MLTPCFFLVGKVLTPKFEPRTKPNTMELYKVSAYMPELANVLETKRFEFKTTDVDYSGGFTVFYFETEPDFDEISRHFGLAIEDGEEYEVEEVETLTPEEITSRWVRMFLPTHIRDDSQTSGPDRDARCESFNNYVDGLEKDGEVLGWIANELCLPDDLEAEMHLQRAERNYC